jgi:hypothetical protein
MSKIASLERFIKNAISVHGNKYTYENVNYKNNHSKINITCLTHGNFQAVPKNHLKGYGCSKCSGNEKLNIESFIEKAKLLHGNKYDYSKSVYTNAFNKLIIICPEHGEFKTTARNHYYKGYGCKKCGYRNPYNKHNTEYFIEQAVSIHGDKYDYSAVQYNGCDKHVIIICKKHNKFSQQASSHINGHGCRKCGASTGEKLINTILTNYNINFVHQKMFKDCINPKTNGKLKFDFYLPDINACIEFDGYQHFAPVKYWGGNANLEKTQYRDQVKNDYCTNNNISLLRIKYNENVEKVVNNFLFSGATSNWKL